MMRSFTSTPVVYGGYAPLTPPSTPSSSASSSPVERYAPRPSSPGLKLRVAGGGSGKGKSFVPERDIYGLREFERKKPASRPETGQDSFFIAALGRSVLDEEGLAVGVADGVGGYIESGFDSAEFSHALCEYMANEATATGLASLSAQKIMRKGYEKVVKDKVVQGGGSTACVGLLKPDSTLEVANLGDSGYYIFRLGRCIYTSVPQTHAFNTPYQLSIIPASLRAQAARYGGVPLCDTPRDAEVTKHRLYEGDVVLFATDGVLDNLFTQQVLQIVTEEMVQSKNWRRASTGYMVSDGTGDIVEKKIVERVVRAAKKAGLDTRTDGPFAKEVQRVFPNERYEGGKPDDVGVVCVVVEGKSGSGRGRL